MFFRKANRSEDPIAMGIDIGSQTVKFVLADQITTRIEIKGAASFPIEEGIMQEGIVKEPRRFARHFAAKASPYDFRKCSAVMSVPSNLAVLRWVSLPILEGEELREAARFKVKKHVPFPIDSAYVQASAPTPEENENVGQSLVMTVRKDVVDSRAEALEMAGVSVAGAELEAQAILRIVERRLNEQSALWRDASLTIIDVGANTTHMYVVQNQKLQFIRGVRFGAERIADAVASELGCSLAEAESMLGSVNAELSPDGMLNLKAGDMPLRISVQQETEKITREFLRLLRYFRSLHPERSYAGILDHVILCGGLTGLKGFDMYLQTVLGLRVEKANPFAGVVGNFNQETFQSIAHRQESFTVSLGLALSALSGRHESTGDHHVRREYVWARSA